MDENNNIKKAPNVPPFLRYCSAIIPTAFDDSLSYYEALCALYKWLQDNLVDIINNNATVTQYYIGRQNELEALFEQLKEYVDNYFDNLDVQEEINNKLDAMVEDGTLEEIIGHYIQRPASRTENGTVIIGNGIDVTEDGTISRDYSVVKFHSVSASSATYILQLPNGKNMIVDSGSASQWTDIKDAIDSLGITKFDYAITTHFHQDHNGNNQNLIDTYDFSECTWWIGMKPDYLHYSDRLEDSEETYNQSVYTLTSNGIDPIVPLNGSTVTLDEDAGITIQFFNTDPNIAENYYNRIREYSTTGKINFNAFSLMANITYGNQSILLTGDIEEYVEEQYARYMKKATIMTAPHHGINLEAYEAFYTAVSPEATICSFVTSSATWIASYYKEFYYITQNSKKVITAYNSKTDSGLYTFKLDGDYFASNVTDGGLTSTSPYFELGSYIHVLSLIDTTKVAKDEITFKDWVLNLPQGATACIPFYDGYENTYTQLVADIKQYYSDLSGEFVVKISRDITHLYITIAQVFSDFSCEIKVSINEWETYNLNNIKLNRTRGSGSIVSTSEDIFIAEINKRPSGTYKLKYKDSSNTSLYNGTYEGIVTIVVENYVKKTGFFSGHIHNTDVNEKRCIQGYFDNQASKKVSVYCWG